MKLKISSFEVTLVCTILVSAICLVLCSDGDNRRPSDTPTMSLQDRPYWPAVNDPVFKDYYEIYRGADPIWKRAPSAGFYGMRGKKVPGSNFFGMRGKKGPSGFLGMRGKKMEGPRKVSLTGDMESLDNLLSDMWTSKESQPGLDFQDKVYNFADNQAAEHYDVNKRAPADGFMGLRGKRDAGPQSLSSHTSH